MKFVASENDLAESSVEFDLEEFATDTRLVTLGNLFPDGLALVDRRGIVRYVNAAAENINQEVLPLVFNRPLIEFVIQK